MGRMGLIVIKTVLCRGEELFEQYWSSDIAGISEVDFM